MFKSGGVDSKNSFHFCVVFAICVARHCSLSARARVHGLGLLRTNFGFDSESRWSGVGSRAMGSEQRDGIAGVLINCRFPYYNVR
jgi:hypothetical protein